MPCAPLSPCLTIRIHVSKNQAAVGRERVEGGGQAVAKAVRIGWIKPDDNVRPDHDCYHIAGWLAARGVDAVSAEVTTSVSSGLHQREELIRIGDVDRLAPPARTLAEKGCDVVAWACTSGSFIGGRAWAEAQCRGIADAGGVPATSTSLAMAAAARAMNAGAVDVLGAYPEDVTRAFAAFLAEHGIAVREVRWLDSPSGPVSFGLDLVAEAAKMPGARDGTPVAVPDTAMNSLNLLPKLEAALGRPVITAVQATLWRALRLAGRADPVPEAGRLFQAA